MKEKTKPAEGQNAINRKTRDELLAEADILVRHEQRRKGFNVGGGFVIRRLGAVVAPSDPPLTEIHKYVSRVDRGLTACGLATVSRTESVSWAWKRVTCTRCLITSTKMRRAAAAVVQARAEREEERRALHAAELVPGSDAWRAAEKRQRQRRHPVYFSDDVPEECRHLIPDEFLEQRSDEE